MTALGAVTTTASKAAVVVCDGAWGIHIGIAYRVKGDLRILHFAFDHDLEDVAVQKDGTFRSVKLKEPLAVQPGLDIEELKLLATFCAKRAKLGKNDIPYGFKWDGQAFALDTEFVPTKSGPGLTCSTFVMAVCEWAKIPLLATATWEPRSGDEQFHEKMIEFLSKLQAPREVVEAARRDKRCVRFRAEEVAACSSFAARPVQFSEAAAAGEMLSTAYYDALG